MNGQQEQGGIAVGWTIFLVILFILFNPIPGPIDAAAVTAVGGYHALKRLKRTEGEKTEEAPMNRHVLTIIVQAAMQVAQILMEKWINARERSKVR